MHGKRRTVNSKIFVTPKVFNLPITKLHSILAVSNLLAYNNFMVTLLCASKFATTKIECSFEMDRLTPLWVPVILLLTVPTQAIPLYSRLPTTILCYNLFSYLESEC